MSNNIYALLIWLLIGLMFTLSACQSASKKEPQATIPLIKFETCKKPRPEFCTKEYKPVCAQKDTGIRCVTTPCPSTKDITLSNACAACSDENVQGYTLGVCK